MAGSYEIMQVIRPDEVLYNGIASQYHDRPLTAKPGDLVRLYVVNAGPNLWSAFQVIGAIFHFVYPGSNPSQGISGVSTYGAGPGEGSVFYLTLNEAGKYPFVDHAMAHAVLGANGALLVSQPSQVLAAPPSSKAPAGTAAASFTPRAVATGPYSFDTARAATPYASKCAACHQAICTGLVGAPLKGNPSVLDADPTKNVTDILHDLQSEPINGATYPSAMPPFADALSDADIADIANHERTSWGNQAKLVTADQVKALRAGGKQGRSGLLDARCA